MATRPSLGLIEQIQVHTETVVVEDPPEVRPSTSLSEYMTILAEEDSIAEHCLRQSIGHLRNMRTIRFELPAYHKHNTPFDARQDSIIIPHPEIPHQCHVAPLAPRGRRHLGAIQFKHPSAFIVHHPSTNTVPFTLVSTMIPVPRSQYTYLHPRFPDTTLDSQNALAALIAHNRRRSKYLPVKTEQRELALIKKQPGRLPAFVMSSAPWEQLTPGTLVEYGATRWRDLYTLGQG
ncbi:hypothetical protein C8R44DRAFT_874718 [Mycena epipterygia]|nr:hypothetical protein C8R44DRAFT_874718 [Mycena epipterygia]